jgi:hypothetical protein
MVLAVLQAAVLEVAIIIFQLSSVPVVAVPQSSRHLICPSCRI